MKGIEIMLFGIMFVFAVVVIVIVGAAMYNGITYKLPDNTHYVSPGERISNRFWYGGCDGTTLNLTTRLGTTIFSFNYTAGMTIDVSDFTMYDAIYFNDTHLLFFNGIYYR